MIKAIDKNNKFIYANIANRGNEYFCPNSNCKEKLILKKGLINIPHFAHKKLSKCSNNEEKDCIEHDKMKLLTYNFFKKYFKDLDYEIWIDNQRADLETHEIKKIAFECQYSILPAYIIEERTKKWEEKGYRVFWILHEKYFKEFYDLDIYRNLDLKYIKVNSMMLWLYKNNNHIFYIKEDIKNKNNLDYYLLQKNSKLFKVSLENYQKCIRFNKFQTYKSGNRYILKDYKNKKIKSEYEITELNF